MSWGKPVQPLALRRLHSCQPETSCSLRYAKRRRIQWYRLIPAPQVSRSGSEHALGSELSMRTLARWHRLSFRCPCCHSQFCFTVEFFTGAVFQLRGVPAVFGRAQGCPGSRSTTRNAVIHRTEYSWAQDILHGVAGYGRNEEGTNKFASLSLLSQKHGNPLPCSLDTSTPTWWHNPVSKCIISSLTFVNKHFQFQDSSSHVILRESPARTVTINSITAAPTLTWILQPVLENPPGFLTPVSGNSLFHSGHTTAAHGPRHSNYSVFTSSSIYSLTVASAKMFADTS